MAVYDGGGGGSSTWAGASVPEMWAALADYNDAPHWQMTVAWRQSYELLSSHISQVKQYRDNLATAWSPEKSKAAAAYVLELEGLIENLEETYEASISNHRALSTATSAIMEARRELDGIQKEYSANEILLAQYSGTQTQPSPNPTPTPSPSPQPPPVAPGRQTQLQLQAASIMQSLGAELATAQTSFVAPRPYRPSASFSDSTEGVPTGGGVGVPLMPPAFTPRSITPTKTSGQISPVSGGGGKTTLPNGNSGPSTRPPSEGPVLGGTKPSPNTTIPGQPTTPTNTTTPTNALPGGPLNLTPTPNPTPSGPIPRYPTTNSSPVGGPASGTGARGGSYPNGIIGGTPAAGGGMRGQYGQPGSTTRGGQRVNPAGGILGGQQAAGGAGGHPGRSKHSRIDEDPQNRRWDPDNPWETTDGVDPILLPAPEQSINPGPTIGGR